MHDQTEHSIEDFKLLRRFVEHQSQDAFDQLVKRRLGFVYSVCRREVGDAALAEDVTQAVFLILAQKAPSIRDEGAFAGWLFKTARYASRNALRREMRRQAGEREVIAEMVNRAEHGPSREEAWAEMEPLLHNGIATLNRQDRELILLRYFESRSFKELSHILGTTEVAARKRIERALEKLRLYLKKHGVAVPIAVLSTLLVEQAVQAAPATCATVVAQGVFSTTGKTAGVAAKTAAMSLSLSGALIAMSIKKSVVVLTAVLAIGFAGGGLIVAKKRTPDIISLSFSPNGDVLLTGQDDNRVQVRDARSGKLLRTLGSKTARAHNTPAFSISRDGKMIATQGSDKKSVEIWEVESGRLARKLSTEWESYGNISFSPDSQTVLSNNTGTKLLDTATGQEELTIATGDPGWTALSPDGNILAARTPDVLSLWDTRTGKMQHRLPAGRNQAHKTATIAFSPGGELVSASQDGAIQFWNIETGALTREISQDKSFIRVVVCSPDGSLLATGSGLEGDGSIKVWDMRSGQLRHQLIHNGNRSMAFSPDNTTLVTGGADNTLKLWDMISGKQKSLPW